MAPTPLILALGSNLGDRQAHLTRAVGELARLMSDLCISPVYENPPLGIPSKRPFLNLCLAARCGLSPWDLLEACRKLELEADRRPLPSGDRPLDIDLIFFDALVLTSAKLTLPHPRWSERSFVVQPILDLATRHQWVRVWLERQWGLSLYHLRGLASRLEKTHPLTKVDLTLESLIEEEDRPG